MSKDRPFKNFKSPSERPFKVYNPSSPANASSMLFQDPQQQEQQPLRLGGSSSSINGIMSQQPVQQQQQQHMSYNQQQQANSGIVPQVYGDPEDYLHLNPQRLGGQNPIMSLDPSLTSYYEELGLDDPDNPLIRPELLNETILQREQDLNIGGSQTPGSMGVTPSFLLPNRHHTQQQRIPGSSMSTQPVSSIHDSLSMLFDQSQSSLSQYSTSVQQQSHLLNNHHHQQQQSQQHLTKSGSDPNSELSLAAGGSPGFLNSMVAAAAAAGGHSSAMAAGMMGGNGSGVGQDVNGQSAMLGDILPTSSGINMDAPFPIKREADEGRAGLTDDSPSPSSIQSPSQSDSFGETPNKSSSGSTNSNLKRTHSNGSGGCSSQDMASKRDRKDSGGESSDSQRDPAYLEKRRKNNESAKRSREARRNKEELVALRVITLEEENMKLRAEIGLLDKELDELRTRLFS